MFDVQKINKLKTKPKSKQQKIFVMGGLASLLAACGGEGKVFVTGDAVGVASNDADKITLGGTGGSGVAAGGKGDDEIIGGDKADYISGGLGADIIKAGGGLDVIALLGLTKSAEYADDFLSDVGGTGIDLTELMNLYALRDHVESDVKTGETIDGGADGAWLFIFGDVDFEGVNLSNISKIYLDAEVIISSEQLEILFKDGVLTEILGTGTLRASSGALDLDGLKIAETVNIANSGGEIILPFLDVALSIGEEVSIAENTKLVGKFVVADESAVGDITYAIGSTDAKLFEIDAETGELRFILVPDFENPLDNGGDNVYNVTMTATDEHGKSLSVNIAISVTDVAADPILQVINSSVATGAEFLVNSQVNANQFAASVGGLKNGGYVVAWQSDDGTQDESSDAIKAQIYAANGTKLAPEFLVNSEALASQSAPAIAVLNDGGFVISWTTSDELQDNSGTAIKAQLFAADGTKVGTEFLVNTQAANDQSQSAIVALSNGGFAITWLTSDAAVVDSLTEIKVQLYLADGTKSGAEFLASSDAGEAKSDPLVASLSQGGFVVAWTSVDATKDDAKSGIKAQIYANNGNLIGTEFLVNEQKTGTQSDASITGLLGGGFVVTWQTNDTVQDGDGDAIKAQIYATNGDKVGDEFLVNQEKVDDQQKPEIIALNDGGFVIVWQSNDSAQDGASGAVKGQIFTANGGRVGDEFLINSQAEGEQLQPEISALNDDGFIVAWHSADGITDDSGQGVKAQIFKYSPILKYDNGQSYDFNINAQSHPNQTAGSLGDIIISGIPSGVTFNQGDLVDGVLTLSAAQLSGLEIILAADFSGQLDLLVRVESTDNLGGILSTEITVPISVGTELIGQGLNDVFDATQNVDHVSGGDGVDLLKFSGAIADYSFAILGDDIQVTHIASGQANIDLIHDIEQFKFGSESTIDVKTLDDVAGLTDLVGDDFDNWLVDNYQYDVV